MITLLPRLSSQISCSCPTPAPRHSVETESSTTNIAPSLALAILSPDGNVICRRNGTPPQVNTKSTRSSFPLSVFPLPNNEIFQRNAPLNYSETRARCTGRCDGRQPGSEGRGRSTAQRMQSRRHSFGVSVGPLVQLLLETLLSTDFFWACLSNVSKPLQPEETISLSFWVFLTLANRQPPFTCHFGPCRAVWVVSPLT